MENLMPSFEPREIVIAHEEVWNNIEALLNAGNMTLVQGPQDHADDLPWYFIGVKG
jgi:hypothetical protein